MQRFSFAFLLVMLIGVFGRSDGVLAQATDTPSPTTTPTQTDTATPTQTPTPEPYGYSTTVPITGTPDGQMTRFDYTATAGDVHIANLLTWLVFSLWGMFLFTVLVLVLLLRRK